MYYKMETSFMLLFHVSYFLYIEAYVLKEKAISKISKIDFHKTFLHFTAFFVDKVLRKKKTKS